MLFRAAAVVQGRHEGAQTNAGRAEGVAFVDLEERVELPFGLEQTLHLLARHGVKAAAEAHQLHDFDVGVLESVFGRAVETAVEGPLIDDRKGLRIEDEVRDRVLGHDLRPHGRNEGRNPVVDEGIQMIGMARKHDEGHALGARERGAFFAERVKLVAVARKRLAPRPEGFAHFVAAEFGEGFADAREDRVLALEVDEGRLERNLREGR